MFVPVSQLQPGAIVAREVCSRDGRVLLKPGTALTERYVAMLNARGIDGVYLLEGQAGEQIRLTTTVSEHLRFAAARAAGQLQRASLTFVAKLGLFAPDGLAELLAAPAGQRAVAELAKIDFPGLADDVVGEVLAAPSDSALRSPKGLHDYDLLHSLEVAATAVVVGQQLRLAREELVALAHGCLLQDVGMSLVPRQILAKRGPLDAVELAQVRQHPVLGFELARAVNPQALLPNHVVLNHHERRDGSGYPQGSREIPRLAEICAVADVYDALGSPRPWRQALPDDQVRAQLRSMARTQLNPDVVDALLAAIPAYPVGGKVLLFCKKWPRHRALIVRRNLGEPTRPVVRIYGDAEGQPLDPIDVDLGTERGILIRPAV
jgi:HD-GYP domain-containing protein (c-di-GMP phosphodiesterase class II)